LLVTAPARAVKFTVLAPAGTSTDAGTVNEAGTLLVRETLVPAAGAA